MVASSVSEANGGWRRNRGLWTAMVGGESAVEESEPSLSLRLGIGGADECAGEKPMEFTRAQLSELYHQSLAYTNLAASLPVSPHLLLPLRKSEAGFSCSPVNVALQKHRSASIGFRLEAPNYMNRMSPEPERCRRTDGKRWRCRKNVVPDQKYCDLHVNRGRQCPRKPLEVSKITSLSETRTSSKMKARDLGHPNADFALGIRLSTGISSEVNSENKVFANVRDCCGTSVTTVSSSGSSRTSLSSYGRCQARTYVDYQQNLPRSRVGIDNDVIRRNVFPGLGFSPRSILQGSTNPSPTKCKAEPVFEPWRCRRTDGKKWRCSRDVLPHQKYCERHIHRGSNKLPQARRFGASSVNHDPLTASIKAHISNPANPSTSLSISTPATSQRDEKRGSASSSAESDTTVSDTTVAAYE